MSKMKQIAALTAMLVSVIMYASPAKSAVCFLPDDDGSCGGGDIEITDGSSDPDNKPEEKCEDYPVSAADYEKMKNCFDFTSCTKSKTREVKYKQGGKISGTNWNASNKICCTNGETYDSAEGQCCPTGGCTHECDAPKEWSTTLRSCECPKDREENTNHECCPVGEHADGAICCPEKKHNDGGVCVCDSQYNTDDNGNCVTQTNQTCEDMGKYTSQGKWAYDCAMSGEGTPAKDDDGCWICKKCACPEGTSSTNSCPAKAGYTCVTEKTADTCGRADKCFKYSYGKSCLNKLAQDDLDNNNYTNLSIKRISTNPTGTCLDGYEYRYTGVADDWDNSCYMCILPTCSNKGYINSAASCDKTKVEIENLKVSDGPCYVCTSCEDYKYITVTQDNYNDVMKKCSLESVKLFNDKLQCWKCKPTTGDTTDECSGQTITAKITCHTESTGNTYCSSYVPTCQARVVNMEVFSSSGKSAWEGGIGTTSHQAPGLIDYGSYCVFYGPTKGYVGTSRMQSDVNGNRICTFEFTK